MFGFKMEHTMELKLNYTPEYNEEDLLNFEKEFSRLEEECYADHAGATLYSDSQMRNIIGNMQRMTYANPHSGGVAGANTHDIIEQMRNTVLEHFHTSVEEYSVIFTSGATSSLKTIAETFVFDRNKTNDAKNAGHFVYMQDNHTSVLGMRDLVSERGAKITSISHNDAIKIFENPLTFFNDNLHSDKNSLFAFSAQCNFSGLKYPLKWIDNVHKGSLSVFVNEKNIRWYVLLDAASFVATNDLNLSLFKPDFVCLSFYKMFGYPTGLGALLVKNSSSDVLKKQYYGGGTVKVVLSSEMFHKKRTALHERFEDGTINYLSVISLQYGFDILSKISMKRISKHVFSLMRILHHSLLQLHHHNGTPVVKIYSDTDYENGNLQGGIIAFNILRSNGEYVGYVEFLNMASLFKIHVRTGCFCNPGACQRHLSLSNEEILKNYEAGYVCGGSTDLINGKPTGAIRISFGYMSTIKDVDTILNMIKKCFVDGPLLYKLPSWWDNYKILVQRKYCQSFENDIQINDVKHKNTVNTSKRIDIISTSIFSENHINKLEKWPKYSKNTEQITLKKIFIYPIKSCGAYEIEDSWILGMKGLKYDREWMILTSAGTSLTQKQNIKLCLIKPVLNLKRNCLTLSFPGMPSIDITLEYPKMKSSEGLMCQSRVCGHKVEGFDCGLEISEWLSLAVGQPNLKLIRQNNFGSKKPVKHSIY
ncbi:molybdenum cofactor sulfurase isoform X2 [Prorops nasuta]|uniref:molybdenum cofactor sulfurase isoform X2 n=1 Tax=Prorops nasuta TaxID=863751 RepID=UPI0034CE58F2